MVAFLTSLFYSVGIAKLCSTVLIPASIPAVSVSSSSLRFYLQSLPAN